MHYRMPALPSMFDLLKTADDFLEGKKNIERTKGSVTNIEAGKLPNETKIIVLSLE